MSIANRSKWTIAQYGMPLAIALALLGLVALGGAWSVYSNPPTERVSETVGEQQFATEMQTSAEVTGTTGLYQTGQVLENHPVYFFNASENVSLRTDTTVPETEPTTVSKRLLLHHRAARGGETFWESRRVLASTEEEVTDGEVSVETSLDMADVRETVRERRAEIGAIGTFTTELRLQVSYGTDDHSGELASTSPVVFSERAFWFESDLAANRTHSVTETRTETGSPDLGTVLGFGALGLLAIGLAAGLVGMQLRGIDVASIETELAKTRYEEWISRGEIPTKAEKQYIRIDTLEDLVDIAIDSNKRVIYDTEYDAYGVVDGDIVYYYADDEVEFLEWVDI